MRTLPLRRVACVLLVAATHPSTAQAQPNVVSICEIRWSNPTAVVVAEAHALGPEPAASTTVTCTVTRNPGEEITVRTTAPGPAVVAASVGTLGPAAFTVCSSSTATWVNKDLTVTERTEAEHCHVAYGDG